MQINYNIYYFCIIFYVRLCNMRVLEYFSKISTAAESVPTIDTYRDPDTGKYLSLTGFIQQNVFKNKNDTSASGLLISTSTVANKLSELNASDIGEVNTVEPFYITSNFTLFVKNEDNTFSSLPFELSYVNVLPEPRQGSYSTVSIGGTGIFYNKQVKITVEYNPNKMEDTWSKITLSLNENEEKHDKFKEFVTVVETIIELSQKIFGKQH